MQILVRLTKTLLEEARKFYRAWKTTGEQVGKKHDREFILREIAGLINVPYLVLKKRIFPKLKRKKRK